VAFGVRRSGFWFWVLGSRFLTICLVTDSRRLAGLRVADSDRRRCLLAQARFAVEAGVDLIQVRERDLDGAALAGCVSELLSLTRGTATRVVVNDRLDVALACGADGVHLRADSIPVAAARRLAPAGFVVGRSVHTTREAAEASDADYLVAGTVFRSASKDLSQRLLGIDGLRAIVAAAAVPVLAIGGISLDHLSAVASTGAGGIAAIGLFMQSAGEMAERACAAIDLRAVVGGIRTGFDRVNTGP
jgi:thiamine-phosphate pyrophosphorylase